MAAPNIAYDIAYYLTNTTGLAAVKVGALPPTSQAVNAYAVVEFGGLANDKTHGSVPRLENANLQIQARHKKTQTALSNILAVADALDGQMDTTINTVVYTLITETSRPRLLEVDNEGGWSVAIWECRVQARR